MKTFLKPPEWVEATVVWYAFIAFIIGAGAFIIIHFSLLSLLIITPVITAGIGYFLRSYRYWHNPPKTHKIMSIDIAYEETDHKNHKYTVIRTSEIKALQDNFVIYRLRYYWSGDGIEYTPRILGKDQYLLSKKPYIDKTNSPEWREYFIALKPAKQRNEYATIKYSQKFHGKKHDAKPCLTYASNVSIERLVLRVKFERTAMPKTISAYVYNLPELNKVQRLTDKLIQQDDGWVALIIEKTKINHDYRIIWEF